LSKALDKLIQAFKPEAPLWACEFTSRHVIVAGVHKKRGRIEGKLALDLHPGSFAGSLDEPNVLNLEAVGSVTRDALNRAAFQGSEIGVVIPDSAARIAFLNAENLPADPKEQLTFVRWKLKKTVPFDVDSAQIAFKPVGRHAGNGAAKGGVDLLVALSPRAIVQQYETLMEDLNLHAGFIVPSTLAALNLFNPPAEDSLFVKVAPDCVTTSIFQRQRMTFYRRVTDMTLYDAVFPTILYYQDKLGGASIRDVTVCNAAEADSSRQIAELEHKLQIRTQRLDPKNTDDLFKPALGAVHLLWKNLI
jgi:type IV pilus assembly protein PilM